MAGNVAEVAVQHRAQGQTRSRVLLGLAFYLLIPLLFAVEQGASESGSFAFTAKRYYFYYFLSATLPVWWAMDLMTRLVQWILRPWDPPLVAILFLGAVLALNLQATWTPLRHALFEPYLVEGSTFFQVFPWRYTDLDYLREAVLAWVVGGGIWVAVNLFFLKVLNYPRYGFGEGPADPGADAAQGAAPAAIQDAPAASGAADVLLDKLPERLGRNVVALKAEEHYTRVYTENGEELVLMRFGDAVELLESLNGVQTHRSYWVNPAYVRDVVRDGRSSYAELITGLSIPISRSYRLAATKALQRGSGQGPD
jgi:hypothetical protein